MDKLDYRYTLLARKVDMKLGKIFVICKNLRKKSGSMPKKRKKQINLCKLEENEGRQNQRCFLIAFTMPRIFTISNFLVSGGQSREIYE